MAISHLTRRFRVSMSAFLAALYVFFAVGIWAVQEQKFATSADLTIVESQLTVQNDDLKKGIGAANQQLEVVNGQLQLKQNSEFTDWTKLPAAIPLETIKTFTDASGLTVDPSFFLYPLTVSTDTKNQRAILQLVDRTLSLDLKQPNQWSKILDFPSLENRAAASSEPTVDETPATGSSALWSNHLQRLLINKACRFIKQLKIPLGAGLEQEDIVIPVLVGTPGEVSLNKDACQPVSNNPVFPNPGGSTDPSQAFSYLDPVTEQIFAVNGMIDLPTGALPSGGIFSATGNVVTSIKTFTVFDLKKQQIMAFRPGGATLLTKPSPTTTTAADATPVFTTLEVDQAARQANSDATSSTNLNNSFGPDNRIGFAVGFDPDKKDLYLFGGFRTSTTISSVGQLGGCQGVTGSKFGPVFKNQTACPAGIATPTSILAQTTTTNLEPTNEVWSYNLDTKKWTNRDPINQPAGRGYAPVVYDQKNKRFVLFGGLTKAVVRSNAITWTASNQTFAYDPAKNEWAQIRTKTAPDPRFMHALTYDPASHQILMVGGHTEATITTLPADQTSGCNNSTPAASPTVPNLNLLTAACNALPKSNETWALNAGGFPSEADCRFDVGGALVQGFKKYTAIKRADLPAGTSVSVQFAGSSDGVTFSQFSTPVKLDPSAAKTDVIDLSKLVPTSSRFLRLQCTLASTDPTKTPSFGGFTVDFSALGSLTISPTAPATTPAAPITPLPTITTPPVALAKGQPVAAVLDQPKNKQEAVKPVEPKPQGLKLVATGGSLGFNLLIAALLAILTTAIFLRKHGQTEA